MARPVPRAGAAAVTAACLALGLAACSAGYVNPDSSSQRLRRLDTAAFGTAHAQATYTKAFAKLNGECAEQDAALAAVVSHAVARLRQAHAPGASALGVMRQMAAAIPAGSRKVSCTAVAAAYLARSGARARG